MQSKGAKFCNICGESVQQGQCSGCNALSPAIFLSVIDVLVKINEQVGGKYAQAT